MTLLNKSAEVSAELEAVELANRLKHGDIPIAEAPGLVAPGDQCHFVAPARFGRRRSDHYGHPMGPLRVSDVVGLDVRLKIADYLHQEFGEPKFEAPRVLRDKVTRGELGKKTGRGFYDW